MGNSGREQKNLSGFEGDFLKYFGTLRMGGVWDHQLQDNFPFQLIEKFFALVDVKVLSGIGSTNNHHNEVGVADIQLLVAYGWFKEVPVFFDPLVQRKGH
jgi:hypothetical protein